MAITIVSYAKMSISSVDIDNTAFSVRGCEGINSEVSRLTRDRSYSDAHCLFDKKGNDGAVKLSPSTAAHHDAAVKDGSHVRHVHHHGPSRPRSKSESEYRPSHHKKKNTSHGKYSSGTHSPHHGPRPCSPKNLHHMSCGKMWIRPVPKHAGRSSPPHGKYAEHSPHTSPLISSYPSPHVRQVSQSPPDEAEMNISIPMLYSSPNSSFDEYHKEKPVVAFGESGKPIKPHAVFGHRHKSPTNTALAGIQAFQWQT